MTLHLIFHSFSAIASYAITINTLPNSGSITGTDSVCQYATTTLSDAVTGGTWSSTDTTIATIAAGVVRGMSVGIDTIKYTVTNVCGSTNATLYVKVLALPNAGVVIGATNAVCVGHSITLTDTAAGGVWSMSSASASIVGIVGDSVLISGVSAGVDTVYYTVNTSCGSLTGALPVVIDTVPTLLITSRQFVCLGTRDNVDTLTGTPAGGLWTSNNLLDTIDINGFMTPRNAGLDTIHYSMTNACGTQSTNTVIAIYTAWQCDSILSVKPVAGNMGDGMINVYPNPSLGEFTVEIQEVGMHTSIEVMDIYGKVIETREIKDRSASKVEFNYSHLASGTYMIKVISDEKTYRGKVLVVGK